MQFEKNYDRKAMVEMENGEYGYKVEAGADYKDRYIHREKYFAGEILDVMIAYARTEREEKTSKKGNTYWEQKLTLILVDRATSEWFRVRLRGAYIDASGKEGHNPVKLQDFFELCSMQRENFLDGAEEHSFDYQGRHVWWESYPNMIGLNFKVVIAHTDNFNSSPVNSFEIYDPNGFSFVEKRDGIKQPTDMGCKQVELINEHKELYPDEPLDNADPVTTDMAEAIAEPVMVAENGDLDAQPVSNDDDDGLPF